MMKGKKKRRREGEQGKEDTFISLLCSVFVGLSTQSSLSLSLSTVIVFPRPISSARMPPAGRCDGLGHTNVSSLRCRLNQKGVPSIACENKRSYVFFLRTCSFLYKQVEREREEEEEREGYILLLFGVYVTCSCMYNG